MGKEKVPSGAPATTKPFTVNAVPGSVVPDTRITEPLTADPFCGLVRTRDGAVASYATATESTAEGLPARSQARASTRFGPTEKTTDTLQLETPEALTQPWTTAPPRLSAAVPETGTGLAETGGCSAGAVIVTVGGAVSPATVAMRGYRSPLSGSMTNGASPMPSAPGWSCKE